jgi:hypothetical protein
MASLDDVRRYLGNRWALLALAAAALGAGRAFNWSWLVAAGITPLLLAVLPCVAMCALGLCLARMTAGSSTTQPSLPASEASAAAPAPPAAAPSQGNSEERPAIADPTAGTPVLADKAGSRDP